MTNLNQDKTNLKEDKISLEPCPFCGKQPKRFTCKKNLEDGYYVIYRCSNKNHEFHVTGDSDIEAIEAWNTRYEKTCKFTSDDKFSIGAVQCDCGEHWFPENDKSRFKFCPNCGARVVND